MNHNMITMRIIDASRYEKRGNERARFRALVETTDHTRYTVIMSEDILTLAKAQGNVLHVKATNAFQSLDKSQAKRQNKHRLCACCRMVDVHAHGCAGLPQFTVEIPSGARTPRANADRSAWIAFFQRHPNVMLAVLNLPSKAGSHGVAAA
jgi:hypothetical protein